MLNNGLINGLEGIPKGAKSHMRPSFLHVPAWGYGFPIVRVVRDGEVRVTVFNDSRA